MNNEQKTALLDAAIVAQKLTLSLWRAYYADLYQDTPKAEDSIDEARIQLFILKKKLKQLPPSTSFPENMIPENEQ